MSTTPSAPVRPPSRLDWIVLACALSLLPLIAFAALQVRNRSADVTQWLPQTTPELRSYSQFVDQFGVDDAVLLSWADCTLDDPRLAEVARRVREQLAAPQSGRPALIGNLSTSREVYDRLTRPPLRLSPEAARDRMAGFMLGRETGRAVLVAHATDDGRKHNALLVRELEQLAVHAGVPLADLRLGGSVYEAVVVDQESLQSLRSFALPSGLAVMLLALACVRDWRLATIMLVISGYCQCLSVAVLTFTGATLDAVQMIMPTLVFVTTMSGCLHLVNYFNRARAYGVDDPAGWMLRHGWKPCFAAGVTTGVGLLSLTVSQVEPVRMFGLYAGTNVCLSAGMMLLLMPPALRAFASNRAPSVRAGRMWSGLLDRSVESAFRHRLLITCGAALLVGLGAAGLPRLKSSLNLQEMFPAESPLVANYTWMEQEIGPLISFELVLSWPHEAGPRLLDQLEFVRRVDQRVHELPEVEATMSALTFVPPPPPADSLTSVLGRSIWLRRLQSQLPRFEQDGVVADDGHRRSWRVTTRVSALAGLEYHDVAAQLQRAAYDLAAETATPVRTTLDLHVTGMTAVVYRAQQQMLSDLSTSFLTALLCICPLLMWQLGDWRAGLLAMIPNLAPVAIVFGALAWAGRPVNIGVMLTASVGLGLAVDGTLHYLHWFRAAQQRGRSVFDALSSAHQTCARAMIQTTLICGLGLLVFAFSSFLPTARFAWMLTCLLLTALASDLWLTPALLAGPLGKMLLKTSRQVEFSGKEDIAAPPNNAGEPRRRERTAFGPRP